MNIGPPLVWVYFNEPVAIVCVKLLLIYAVYTIYIEREGAIITSFGWPISSMGMGKVLRRTGQCGLGRLFTSSFLRAVKQTLKLENIWKARLDAS